MFINLGKTQGEMERNRIGKCNTSEISFHFELNTTSSRSRWYKRKTLEKECNSHRSCFKYSNISDHLMTSRSLIGQQCSDQFFTLNQIQNAFLGDTSLYCIYYIYHYSMSCTCEFKTNEYVGQCVKLRSTTACTNLNYITESGRGV